METTLFSSQVRLDNAAKTKHLQKYFVFISTVKSLVCFRLAKEVFPAKEVFLCYMSIASAIRGHKDLSFPQTHFVTHNLWPLPEK